MWPLRPTSRILPIWLAIVLKLVSLLQIARVVLPVQLYLNDGNLPGKTTWKLPRWRTRANLEFMLPLGRWAGYGGETDHNGTSFETLTWASGLLAATQNIMAFSTLHVALVHPIFAAKQMVTADHIGKGRFGLNIVCGWNADEFNMFGIGLEKT